MRQIESQTFHSVENLKTSCVVGCGLTRKRIIGGEGVKENEFPWMCSILFNDYTVYLY